MPAEARRPSFRPLAYLAFLATIAALSFGKDFFLPLALAILISFLLAPIIDQFEKLRIGRIASVICVTGLTFALIGLLGYLLTDQLMDLAEKLPGYKTNLQAKIESVRPRGGGKFDKAKETIQELTEEMKTAPDTAPAADGGAAPVRPAGPPPKKKEPVVQVEMVKDAGGTLNIAKNFLGNIMAPLGTAAVVIIIVIFMSIEREDLRDRFIHLIGRGRLRLTTQAINDAGNRVSRYLVAQLIVNVTYGVPIGVGLWLIGIPNAFLWGALATVLRFLPYIGPWIASAFPVALSLAVEKGWALPLMTIGLFIVVELISNNVVEPWLYGSSTGLSPVAIIISAVFWTWLWGGIGLVMATPLTVCLCVIGKYLPKLAFFDVLLGDKPPISPADLMYQRLLAIDDEEVSEFAEEYIEEHSFAELCDNVLLPAINQIERDHLEDVLTDAARLDIYQQLKEMIAEVTQQGKAEEVMASVLLIPANHIGDEIAASMLAAELTFRGVPVEMLSSKLLAGEIIEMVIAKSPPLVVISALPPASILAAASLVKRIEEKMPKVRTMAAVWPSPDGDAEKRHERMRRAGADDILTSIAKAGEEIAKLSAHLPKADNAEKEEIYEPAAQEPQEV